MTPSIHLTYPQPGHETAELSTFIVGRVSAEHGPQLTFTLNGGLPEALNTVPSSLDPTQAYFSQKIPLLIGENTLTLSLSSDEGSVLAQHTLHCIRLGPAPIESPSLLSPQGTWWVQPGETVHFTINTPPNSPIPRLQLGELGPEVTLTAGSASVLLQEQQHVIHQTAVFANYHQIARPLDPHSLFIGSQRLKESLEQSPKEATPILLNQQPTAATLSYCPPNLMYRIQDHLSQSPLALIRTAPETGARLTPLPQGTCLNITGRQNNWFRFRLDATRSAWIAEADLDLSPCIPLPPSPVSLIHITEEAAHTTLQIPLSHRVPYQLDTQPDRLILTLYQVSHQCNFIQWQPSPQGLQDAQLTRVSDEALQLTLAIPRFAGVHLAYDGNTLVLSIKTLPKNLQALRVLLDPGHGGEEAGAMAPNGIAEKDWNLSFSQKLAATLQQAGVSVFMTRTTDTTVSLSERAQDAVKQYQPHIVLSLHHNALPDGRDPETAYGPSTYYYYGHSQPVAKILLEKLSKYCKQPAYGLLYDSLALTRIPAALAVLIELGFFTHPTEVAAMERDDFQDAACNAILEALKTITQTL